MPRILVTGGFGFLGSHLVETLLFRKPAPAHIHIIDDLSTGQINHDLTSSNSVTYDIATVQEYLATTRDEFDAVYHLASIVGPAGVLPHAGRIAISVINDSCALVEKAMIWGARLLDVSTSEIYGGGYSSEDSARLISAKTTVRLEYAVGKLAAETALLNSVNVRDADVIIVRPFNIAGPRQLERGGFVLPRFCHAALSGKSLTVFGDGSQVRAFTHVRDTAWGLRLAMKYGNTGEVYNLGNKNNKTTILALAEKVIRRAHSRSTIEFVDPKTIYGEHYAEANDKIPNAKKARQQLGWYPRCNLDKIIDNTLQWTAEHS